MKRNFLILTALVPALIVALAVTPALQSKADTASHGPVLAAGTIPHYGLAGRYPGDAGLATDSSVVFYENFESGDIPGLVGPGRWTSWNNKDEQVLSFVMDSIPGGVGKRCLLMTGTKGHDTGGDLWKLLDKGYDRLYARFYVKFAPDAPYVHHFVHMGGKTSTIPWPEGGAGTRPTDNFSTSLDLGSNAAPPGAWFFYTYWPEMRSWQTPQGESDGRPSPFYGNGFPYPADTLLQAKRGEWQCLEIMIKLNTPPDGRDGEQAFWVDGKLVNHWYTGSHTGTWFRDKFFRSGDFNTDPKPFEGFLWRKTENLKINTFWLQYYLESVFSNNVKPTDPSIPYNSNVARVQFDNIVLSTRYIGPIAANSWSRSDFDGDGKAGVGDVIRMVKMRVAEPDDMRTDYDGDGKLGILDPLRMLLDILKG